MRTGISVISAIKNTMALAVLLVGIILSIGISYEIHLSNQQRINDAVRENTLTTIQRVTERITLYQYGLRGARGSILTAGENDLSRAAFYQYSLTRDTDSEFPGARGFGFIRLVPREKEKQFVEEARKDGWPDFSIRELNPNDGDRYVIQYIEPVDRNRAAVGLDIASERNRRLAAESSMRSGEVRLTGPITLVQATGNPKQSFLIMMPIYRGGKTPESLFDKENMIFGWSYAPLLMEEVLKGLGLENEETILKLSDVTEPDRIVDFYSNNDSTMTGQYQRDEIRTMFGRTWRFHSAVTPQFVKELHLPNVTVVGTLCAAISILISILVGAITTNLNNRRRLHEEQTRLSAIVESSGDGIIGKTLDGTVTSWNRGAEQIFGFSRQEAVGRSILELVVPPDRRTEELSILSRISQGESIPHFETIRRRKDGTHIPVSVTVSPIYSDNNKVIGASKTVRDISRQKEAEAQIHELNTNLEKQVQERTAELAKLNALVNSVLSAATEISIIATDTEGVIRLFNNGAERMLGYKAGEVLNRFTPAIIHVEAEVVERGKTLSAELGFPVQGFRVFVQKPEVLGAETREWTYVRKDGTHFPVMLVVTTIRADDGEITGYLGIATDITEQKQQKDALLAAQRQLLSTTDQLLMASEVAELGIWTWLIADNSLSWNDKMYQLYEYPVSLRESGLNYSHWEARVHPDDVAVAVEKLNAAVAGTGIYDPVFRLNLPSGKARYIHAGAYVERDPLGNAVKVTGINRDITAERELESGLRLAKEEADSANKAKSMFLANMSHEIRTPMNAVLGMLQLMRTTELTTRQDEYASKAQIAATSLLSLLNDILDYSKIDAGKLVLDNHPFQINELMSDLAVVLSANMGKKDVELLFDIDRRLPLSLTGDLLRLQQILTNLASNAIKFTPQGQVILKIQLLEQSTEETARLRFSVIDSGIGISQEQQGRIFEGFTQAEASTTRRYGGTGLGLVISRRLINLMDSDLQLKSEPGHGSCFWFDITLPVDMDSQPHDSASLTRHLPLNVLVVDDNQCARELLCGAVKDLGANVLQAGSGTEAINVFKETADAAQDIQLILMDWRMPDISGIDAAITIKSLAAPGKTPAIIMVTAFGREEILTRHDAGTAPFEDFLTKPVTPQQLVSTVARVLNGEKNDTQERLSPALSRKPLHGLKLLLVEDNEFNRQVASELLMNEGALLDMAHGGLEGVTRVTEGATRYDLVLMDMQMPDIDGLEATRRIRSDQRFTKLPILAMTANVSLADQEQCFKAGMDGHLGKPLDLPRVIEAILYHTQRSGAVTQAADGQDAQSGSTSGSSEQAISHNSKKSAQEPINAILARFGGNEKLYRSLVKDFEVNLQQQLTELEQAISNHDWLSLKALLHTLKGTSGTIGLSHLYQQVVTWEMQLKSATDDAQRKAMTDDMVRVLRSLAEEGLTDLQTSLQSMISAPVSTQNPPAKSDGLGARARINAASASLTELSSYLEAGNLKAIDLAEELLATLDADEHILRELRQLLAYAEALEFDKARSLLAGLTEKL
ncbi:PAS domain S-box protein [Pokkaliibacter sp. MBI-7]|uniref:PAS domain-containing hybrid sensor histidine kinase/response regulator n=1 Tax=Pokkaliibacter sp. MBI-7 TaxID=3040600 RepID=UPI00244B0E08|nr:CHASE domain-containing protein [Pokkaliibacter sp. MBI-7]MDH2435260.1 PAS domain S-box protein [Pokkaliibacter sp. MBI-7]